MKQYQLTLWIALGFLLVSLPNLAQHSANSLVMTPLLTKKLIDSVDRVLQRFYIFPDKAALMGGQLQNQFKQGRYRTLTNPAQLAAQLVRTYKPSIQMATYSSATIRILPERYRK